MELRMLRGLSYEKSEIQWFNLIKSTFQQRKAMKEKSRDNNIERPIEKAWWISENFQMTNSLHCFYIQLWSFSFCPLILCSKKFTAYFFMSPLWNPYLLLTILLELILPIINRNSNIFMFVLMFTYGQLTVHPSIPQIFIAITLSKYIDLVPVIMKEEIK